MSEKNKSLITINTILFVVLLYPIVLFFPNLIGYPAFFLTSPYFFFIFGCLIILILLKQKFTYFKNAKLIIALILVVIYNFSSIRYSLPIFFIFYILILHTALNAVPPGKINKKLFQTFYYIYIVISIPFIFLAHGWDDSGRFLGFIGSPTVYAGIMTIGYAVVAKDWKSKSWKFIILSLITFGLVFISKTRLLLLFLLIFPLLKYILSKDIWLNNKKIFLIFSITVMSVYPLYGVVTGLFPSLVTMRYEEGSKDTSLGLRLYLSNVVFEDYESGSAVEKVIGKGNEHSRELVHNLFKFDIMPHNDFWRLLNDWGVLGFLLFFCLLYQMSIVNRNALYICLVYILLFYSNMVFNTFIISMLVIFYHDKQELKISYEK